MENQTSLGSPNLNRRLFWEVRFDEIDWQNDCTFIIERVIERGSLEEWCELERYYGKEKVIRTLKSEINYLRDDIIVKVCKHFDLMPIDLKCFTRKQSTPRHWI